MKQYSRKDSATLQGHSHEEVPQKYRRRKTTKLRPVFPKIGWMICPNLLAYCMAWYGLFIGKFPLPIMSMTMGLSVIFCAGLSRLTFQELKTEDFLPTDSPSVNERSQTAVFDYNDPDNPSDYPSIIRPTVSSSQTSPLTTRTLRNTQTNKTHQAMSKETINNRQRRDTLSAPGGSALNCRVNAVLIVAKVNKSDPNGKTYNLYEKSMLKEIQAFEDIIYNMSVELRSSTGLGGVYRYEHRDNNANQAGVCTINPSTGDCGGFTLRVMKSLLKTDDGAKDSLNLIFSKIPGVGLTWPHYQSFDLSSFFGRVETVDGRPNSMVKHIGAMREVFCVTDYLSDDYFARYVKIWEHWEQKLDKTVRMYRSEYFDIYWMTQYQKDVEQQELMADMLPKLGITFLALMIWCFVGALMIDAVRAKPWAGVIGVTSTLIACAAGFGIGLWLDPSFKVVLMALPLMTLAIGLDDMFIMLEAWSETNHMIPVEERMMLAMHTGGTSIVITFFINLLDFIIGNYTPFPIIQLISNYAIATMTYDFICQMTIIGPCLVLFGRNESEQKHSVCCCVKVPAREEAVENATVCSLVCCAGGFQRRDTDDEEQHVARQGRIKSSSHADKEEDSPLVKFLVRILVSLPARLIILLCFVAYAAAAIFSLSQLELGLKPERIYRSSSNLYDFAYEERILFTGYGKEVVVVVTNELDYSLPEIRQRLSDVVDKIENCGFFWDGSETKFWVKDFENWAAETNFSLSTLSNNHDLLFEMRRSHGFLDGADPRTFESYDIDSRDIRMAKNGTSILKSRFRFRAKDMSGPSRQVGMMEAIRGILKQYDPDIVMVAYTDEFQLYDQFLSAIPATLYYGGMTLGVTIGVSIFMIPHPACLFWVALFVLSILLGIIGLMRPWGMDLDSVSLINLLVAISFCSDLIAHPIYIFMITPPVDNNGKQLTGNSARIAKAEAVVKEVLAAAVPACVGTTLSIIAMSNSDAYVFITFFRTMFLSVILSILHALIFIPAFLSFIGPSESQIQAALNSGNKKADIEEAAYKEGSVNTQMTTDERPSKENRQAETHSSRHIFSTTGVEESKRRQRFEDVQFTPISDHWTLRRSFRMRGGMGALKDATAHVKRVVNETKRFQSAISFVPQNANKPRSLKNIQRMDVTDKSSLPSKEMRSSHPKSASSKVQWREAFAPPITSLISERFRQLPLAVAAKRNSFSLAPNVSSVAINSRNGAAMLPAKARFNL